MSIPKSEITRSGQLRSFLLQTMQDLKSGEIDMSTAIAIFKISSQVNESLYAEIKTAQIFHALSDDSKPSAMGELAIGDRSKPGAGSARAPTEE